MTIFLEMEKLPQLMQKAFKPGHSQEAFSVIKFHFVERYPPSPQILPKLCLLILFLFSNAFPNERSPECHMPFPRSSLSIF